MVQFGPHALSQGANFNTSLNDTFARSRFESKEACAARAVSSKDVGLTGTVNGTTPVNHPIVENSASDLRLSIGASP